MSTELKGTYKAVSRKTQLSLLKNLPPLTVIESSPFDTLFQFGFHVKYKVLKLIAMEVFSNFLNLILAV